MSFKLDFFILSSSEYDEFKTDEEYWKILDQREMEEELNEYLSKQKEVIIDENSDTSLSSSESDGEQDISKKINLNSLNYYI